MATFECTATRHGKPVVKHYTVVLKDGITETLFNLMKRMGCADITINLMKEEA